MSDSEMALEILKKTNDGEDLCLRHYWLVENAVNKKLNNRGSDEFKKLYQTIISGKYKRPFLHGIKHLTVSSKASVCWKGIPIELYDYVFVFSKEGKEAVRELAKRCRHLENIGVKVDATNIGWHWSKYKNRKKAV